MSELKGNMLIAQSGGPSMVINRSLVAAVLEAKRHRAIRSIYGALHGIKGILGDRLVDLGQAPEPALNAVAATPSSALGSVRKKPKPEECRAMFEIMRAHGIRYFFYIGGNDSAETAHIVNEQAKATGYPLCCMHIPKTIDNDLRENDHTPGFGSAARFVACAVMGGDLDNRALPGVKIDIVMGRHAGFLTAAAALARRRPDDGPHLIYLPERPFSVDRFTADVRRVYQSLKRCVVVVSEGIADERGTPIAAAFSKEVDAHGNVQLSGSGALGDLLASHIKAKAGIERVRADTYGYLQRSFPGIVSETDAREAAEVGRLAVRWAVEEQADGSVAIRRTPGPRYDITYQRVPLEAVAKTTRHMPDAFIHEAGNDVTPAFLDYARPIVGPLPETALLECGPVPPARPAPERTAS